MLLVKQVWHVSIVECKMAQPKRRQAKSTREGDGERG